MSKLVRCDNCEKEQDQRAGYAWWHLKHVNEQHDFCSPLCASEWCSTEAERRKKATDAAVEHLIEGLKA